MELNDKPGRLLRKSISDRNTTWKITHDVIEGSSAKPILS